jgi:glutamyl-tRNA reductase
MAGLGHDRDERLTTTVEALRRHHEQFRVGELERARRSLAGGMPEEKVVEELARRLTNKFMHGPMQALNHATAAERARLMPVLQLIYCPLAE